MALTIKQYLRHLDKNILKQLIKETELTEQEFWLLTYAFVDKRMVLNTCAKLSISERKYHYMLNEALIKVYYTIKTNPKQYSLI